MKATPVAALVAAAIVAAALVGAALGASGRAGPPPPRPWLVVFALSPDHTARQASALEERLRADRSVARLWYVGCREQVAALKGRSSGTDPCDPASPANHYFTPFVCVAARSGTSTSGPAAALVRRYAALVLPGVERVTLYKPVGRAVSPCVYR
jgi:hypothetical protein